MKFTETRLAGAFIVEPEPRHDDRGSFARIFCASEFAALGLDPFVAQGSVSFSSTAGTIRGLHWQIAPHEETKLVRCVRGAVFDVIVDLRASSATFLEHVACVLRAASHDAIYVPRGFAHGFQTLDDDTEVEYLMSSPFVAGAGRGLRYDDPALTVEWPLPPRCVSSQDAAWPFISDRDDLRP